MAIAGFATTGSAAAGPVQTALAATSAVEAELSTGVMTPIAQLGLQQREVPTLLEELQLVRLPTESNRDDRAAGWAAPAERRDARVILPDS